MGVDIGKSPTSHFLFADCEIQLERERQHSCLIPVRMLFKFLTRIDPRIGAVNELDRNMDLPVLDMAPSRESL